MSSGIMPIKTHHCKRCGQTKPITEFYSIVYKGHLIFPSPCKVCKRKKKGEYYATVIGGERVRKWHRTRQADLKESAINVYSNGEARCACCGQADMDVLCLDHVHNDGNTHRKILRHGGGGLIYKWARDHNYPLGFQVLCSNCNRKKAALYLKNHKIFVSLGQLKDSW